MSRKFRLVVSSLLTILVVLLPVAPSQAAPSHKEPARAWTDLLRLQEADNGAEDVSRMRSASSSTPNMCPGSCATRYVRVENPANSETVEAIFCESDIPGLGALWLRSNATVGHVVKVMPDPGVQNIAQVAGLVWGPDY